MTENEIIGDNPEILGNLNSTMNSKYTEEARCFLSFIGNFCGANSDDGEGCGRTVEELEIIWMGEQMKKGISKPIRKKPFLIVNEKYGRGLDRIKDGKKDYCGNVNYFCKSCNMLYSRRTGDIKESEIDRAGFQCRKSHEVRPMVKNEVIHYLINNTHLCKKVVTHNWSDEDRYRCSPQLMIDALEQIRGKKISEIDIADFGIVCNEEVCNGTHLIIIDQPPMPSVTKEDVEAFVKSMKK